MVRHAVWARGFAVAGLFLLSACAGVDTSGARSSAADASSQAGATRATASSAGLEAALSAQAGAKSYSEFLGQKGNALNLNRRAVLAKADKTKIDKMAADYRACIEKQGTAVGGEVISIVDSSVGTKRAPAKARQVDCGAS